MINLALESVVSTVAPVVDKTKTIEDALLVMGKGMLGIFLALGIVYFFVVALTKLFPEKKDVAEETEETGPVSETTND